MPALCSRNTNEAAEPSRIGTSSAVMSTLRLSRPRPEQAESRCSTVFTFGPAGSPPAEIVVAIRVSQTEKASTLIVDRARQVDAAKDDARVGRRRAQRHLDPLPAVHADADGPRHRLQGALRQHGAIVPGTVPVRRDRGLRRTGGRLSVGLLAQERRDLDLVHAVARQRIDLGRGGAAVAPDARRGQAASSRAFCAVGICTCWLRTGRLSVPVRCTGALCTTCIGVWTRARVGLRPVAITVTRSWSPSDSS